MSNTVIDRPSALPPLAALHAHLTTCVLGAHEPATLLLTALIAGGHVLIEGAPGIGKTSLAQAMATSIGGSFKRVQFTPDLLPSDILGYHLFRQDQGIFEFIPGPVFANCLLADEINRTSPRIQSALLECMNESQVTIDGQTRALQDPFLVIATQNDTYATGTFPLPEPQLDRFLLSIAMSLPDLDTQRRVLLAHAAGEVVVSETLALVSLAEIRALRAQASALPVSEAIANYITELCDCLRRLLGAEHAVSIRASLAIMRAAQAHAVLDSQPAVHPDHVQAVFEPVMRHRLIPEDGTAPQDMVRMALEQTPVP